MFFDWLMNEPLTVFVTGLGAALLGLGLLLAGSRPSSRKGLLGLLLTVAVLTGSLVAAGLPAWVWLPPPVLIGFWTACCGLRDPAVERVVRWVWRRLRQPRCQGGLLLTSGLIVAVGWPQLLDRQTQAEGLDPSAFLEADLPEQRELPFVQAFTDLGRPIRLQGPAELADALKETLLSREQAILRERGKSVVQLAPPSFHYNCHGWTFGAASCTIRGSDVPLILQDNGYRPVSTPRVGDLVVYWDSAGQVVHTAVVFGVSDEGVPIVQSKWGYLGRYLHPASEQPYGMTYQFYRSRRDGHQLRGLSGKPLTPSTGEPAG